MERAIHYDPVRHCLRVGEVVIDDPVVLREATRWTTGVRGPSIPDRALLASSDLTAFVSQALGLGARVLAATGQERETTAIDEAVSNAATRIEAATQRATRDAEESTRRVREAIVDTTRQVQDSIIERVTELVGGDHPELVDRLMPALHGVGATLETQVVGAVEKATSGLVADQAQRHEHLAGLVHEVHREVAAVKAADQVRAVTTVKGFDYETTLHEVMSQVAAATGDEYVPCGDTAGLLPRNKKGDGYFRVNGTDTKVVVEAHDGASKEWSSYLAEAERNRAASTSIGCVRRVEDNDGHLLRVLGPRRVVVAYDPDTDTVDFVRTVVLLMRTVALTHTGRFGVEEVATAHDRVEDALAALTGLNEAHKAANAILGNAEKVISAIRVTTTSVERSLSAATEALTGAKATVPQPDDHTVDGTGRP